MGNTNQGVTVTWKGSAVGQVAGGGGDDGPDMEDCSTLDDAARDFRAGLENPTANLVISLKDSNTNPFTKDDHGALVVGSDFNNVMRVHRINKDVSVGAHRTVDVSFVSTTES
jgi:hypothetical protein